MIRKNHSEPSLIKQLAIRLRPQAGKSLVILRRREYSKISAPRCGQKPNVGSLRESLLKNWIPACEGMTYRGANGLFCVAIGACFSTFQASAQDIYSSSQDKVQDTILFRPQAGIGAMNGVQYWHEGFRLLLNASDTKKYGLEYSRVHTVQGDYIASGIVLEEKRFGWLNLSIGTIGYNGQGRV